MTLRINVRRIHLNLLSRGCLLSISERHDNRLKQALLITRTRVFKHVESHVVFAYSARPKILVTQDLSHPSLIQKSWSTDDRAQLDYNNPSKAPKHPKWPKPQPKPSKHVQ